MARFRDRADQAASQLAGTALSRNPQGKSLKAWARHQADADKAVATKNKVSRVRKSGPQKGGSPLHHRLGRCSSSTKALIIAASSVAARRGRTDVRRAMPARQWPAPVIQAR